jgi:hypothetical protein
MRKLFILIAAGAFLVAYTAPAIAAEWEFFGNVMFRTFWEMDDDERTGTGFDDDDLLWGRDAGVAVGATVKAGDISGFVQYRPVEAQVHSGDLSQFYGTWDFGTGALSIGKMMGPANFFPSKQVWLDNQGLVGQGGIFTYFKPMLMGTFGGFKIALVEPQTTIQIIPVGGHPAFQVATSNNWVYSQTTPTNIAPIAGECDTTIPKIEASYTFDAGPVGLFIGGGYQTFDEVDISTDNEYSIDSWIFGVGFKIPLGALYVNGIVTMNQNSGQYQTEWYLQDDDARWDPVDQEIIDNEGMGYNLVVGYVASDKVDFEAGWGHSENELDIANPQEDDLDSYYIQMNYRLADGVTLTPEIGMIDWGDNILGVSEGETTYYGARWQIVF